MGTPCRGSELAREEQKVAVDWVQMETNQHRQMRAAVRYDCDVMREKVGRGRKGALGM